MSKFLSLPNELLTQIGGHLHLADLESLARTCQCLADLYLKRLQEQRKLRQRYRHIDSDFLEENHVGWFYVLLAVLRDEIPAEYIEEIDINGESCDPRCDWGCQGEDLALLADAVNSSRWIYDGEEKEDHMVWFGNESDRYTQDKFRDGKHGTTDYIMSVLVPLLPNLQLLILPTVNLTLPRTVGRIATIAAAQSAMESKRDPLPLSKLTHIRGTTSNCFVGMELKDVAPFIALPSVRIFEALQMGDDEFEWPISLPRSHLAEATFTDGCITSGVIRAFARGLRGPCIISQYWMYPRYHLLTGKHSDWTRIEIPFEDAPIEEWIVERDPRDIHYKVSSPERVQSFIWSGEDQVIERDVGKKWWPPRRRTFVEAKADYDLIGENEEESGREYEKIFDE